MEKQKEIIWNVPNTLTVLRIVLTFVIIYLIFARFNLRAVGITFAVAALTDWLDGQIARRFNQKTKIGRKLDMIADRFLMIGVVLAFLLVYTRSGQLSSFHLLQIFLFMTREIITFPFALIALGAGWPIPHARYAAKINTVVQNSGFVFLVMSIQYPIFNFSMLFAVVASVLGLISAIYYVNDVTRREKR